MIDSLISTILELLDAVLQTIGPNFNSWLSFAMLTTLVIVSATVAAFSRSIVNAAYSLFFTLIGMAGYYVLLGSDFLAVTQVVVYVGGILVLLMFGVLLTNRSLEEIYKQEKGNYIIAGITAGVFFFVVLAQIIFSAHWGERVMAPMEPSTHGIGVSLLQAYVLPFEFSSVTLLVCLIGAAYMARRKEQ